MGPLVMFILGGGTALIGQKHVKKGLKQVVRTAIKARIELERTVASVREDLEDMTAEVRQEQTEESKHKSDTSA